MANYQSLIIADKVIVVGCCDQFFFVIVPTYGYCDAPVRSLFMVIVVSGTWSFVEEH